MTAQKIIIIEDHALFSAGMKMLLQQHNEFEVLAEFREGEEALKMARELAPDLALVDISLPDINGIEVARQLQKILPKTKIIAVSMHSKPEYIAQMFEAGANGYVAKESAPDQLITGINAVLGGQYYLDSTLSAKVAQSLALVMVGKSATKEGEVRMTSRELEVTKLLAQGHNIKEIADILGIKPKTAETHRTRIMHKLKANNLVDVIHYAARIGLIEPESWWKN